MKSLRKLKNQKGRESKKVPTVFSVILTIKESF